MTKQEEIKHWLSMTQNYAEAYFVILNHRYQLYISHDPTWINCSRPLSTLWSYCLEASIKLLILATGGSITRIHDLHALYSSLSPQLQTELETSYLKFKTALNKQDPVCFPIDSDSALNLEELIKKNKNNFLDSRYNFSDIGTKASLDTSASIKTFKFSCINHSK